MSSRHILVVDDEPEMRLLVRKFLETGGYTVSEAENGEVALQKAKANPPDLVILDLRMPEVDGIEVLNKLKADPGFHAPIMVVTAQTSWKDVDDSINGGADGYMTKPFTRDQLLTKVGEFLNPKP